MFKNKGGRITLPPLKIKRSVLTKMGNIDSSSFFSGMVFCMIFDLIFSIISFFLEKAFALQAERLKKKKNKKESENISNEE